MSKENVLLDSNTGELLVDEVDYELDSKFLKDCNVKFYKKANLHSGRVGFAYFKINNYIYIFGGHSAGRNASIGLSVGYEKYLIGDHRQKFYNNLLRYDIKNDHWKDLGTTDEISPRSGMLFCTYNQKMYIFGGYSFEFMTLEYLNDYKKKYGKWPEKKREGFLNEGYEISINDNDIVIKKICELPFGFLIGQQNFVLIENKLYFIGGQTGKKQNQNISTNSIKNLLKNHDYNICNQNLNIGSILFCYNLDNNKLSIESLFPGIPIAGASLICNKEYISVFVSHVFSNESLATFRPGEKNKVACPDNWKYNVNTKEWIRIKNSPLVGNACSTLIKYNEKYALFCGGVRLFLTMSFSKNMKCEQIKFPIQEEFNPKFHYGTISNTYSKCNETHEKHVTSLNKIGAYDYYQHYFSDFILIYDLDNDKYYTCNNKLPVNVSTPCCINHDGNVYFFGSEINDILIDGKFHGIQSNLCYMMDLEINK